MKAGPQIHDLLARAAGGLTLLASGEWRIVSSLLRRQLWSDRVFLGLYRDLTVASTGPVADDDIMVRELRPSDVPKLFDVGRRDLYGQDIYERLSRRRLLRSGIGIPCIAVNAAGAPCYVVWMIGPEDNHIVQRYFHGRFPPLEADEVLFEGAFTSEANRGQHVAGRAGRQIRARAVERGARRAIAFVDINNRASLKACRRSGDKSFLLRLERYRLFRLTMTFTPANDSTSLWFDELG